MSARHTQASLEAQWAAHAQAVVDLGGKATIGEVAAYFGKSRSSAACYVEGAWRRGLLVRDLAGGKAVYRSPDTPVLALLQRERQP